MLVKPFHVPHDQVPGALGTRLHWIDRSLYELWTPTLPL
jgi:hypothetical protein